MPSYRVEYKHPGLGYRSSSRWGSIGDAKCYAAGLPDNWYAGIILDARPPEIFRHCGPDDDNTNPSQAIGGKCFHCGKVLTRADAIAFVKKG